jgi:predicted DNA-binding transcriptional regulator AlpA
VTDRLLDANEVAERLHVPVSWVRESMRSGAIPHAILGRYKRYLVADVEAWLEAWLEACKQAGRTPFRPWHGLASGTRRSRRRPRRVCRRCSYRRRQAMPRAQRQAILARSKN